MKVRDPSAKAIVFSQFTSMLDILHFRLTQVSRFCKAQHLSSARLPGLMAHVLTLTVIRTRGSGLTPVAVGCTSICMQ